MLLSKQITISEIFMGSKWVGHY